MGCCRTLALVAIAVILIPLQVSYLATKVLRIIYLPPIARESNNSSSPTDWYEYGVFSVVIILQIMEYIVLFYSLCQSTSTDGLDIGESCYYLVYPHQSGQWAPLDAKINKRIQRSWKEHKLKRSVTILLLAILFLLAITIAILAFKRDIQYIDRKDRLQRVLTIVYEFVIKLGIFTANAMIRVFVTGLYWQYVSEWDQTRNGC